MLLLYLAVVITASYWAVKTLAPEMMKPPVNPIPKPVSVRPSVGSAPENEPAYRLEKVEILIAEKNKDIQFLQTELKIYHAQISSFDKVKIMLEDEIHRLREQNRIFRSELGLPAIMLKEKSVL